MKIYISGYGKMGRMIEEILLSKSIECAGKTNNIQEENIDSFKDCICIDFTVPEAFKANYKFLADNFSTVIVGTTGWEDIKNEVFHYFEERGATLIWASNFSIGVNVFMAATQKVSELLGKVGGYDSYIIEKHHSHKLDAPSGTAKSLGDIVGNSMQHPDIYSVRKGEISGIHTVFFEGENDRITLEHEAFSRRGFAEGAVNAAIMSVGIRGVHEFKELIFNKL